MRISDWSSDVCSSDLWSSSDRLSLPCWLTPAVLFSPNWDTVEKLAPFWTTAALLPSSGGVLSALYCLTTEVAPPSWITIAEWSLPEIGRASCRERVWQYV